MVYVIIGPPPRIMVFDPRTFMLLQDELKMGVFFTSYLLVFFLVDEELLG